MVTPAYHPRDPSSTVLYQVIADNLETFLAPSTQAERQLWKRSPSLCYVCEALTVECASLEG
jgi:hypothetical protein